MVWRGPGGEREGAVGGRGAGYPTESLVRERVTIFIYLSPRSVSLPPLRPPCDHSR